LVNAGQSCISAKRFIVEESILENFVKKFSAKISAAKLGPLARADLRDSLHQQVTESILAGAKIICGGQIPNGPGWYYPPTVLIDVKPEMAVFHQETFGPVAAVVAAKDKDDAILLANQTQFGLGAAIFTSKWEEGIEIAATQLEAGSCFVNDFVRSDPRLPFGGIKESGYGRELSSFGVREFVNIKTVYDRP